ncbi:hypothetical protein CDD82_4082 [Ophiocordyceps australis]|uniref:BTB domain-containing protein n=1 Tax=Ophiocordyceps australis TaxID=1399860 RepID=A0A2C5Z9X3_9HYPO|nr:hypothetical protein CDD82_4082 [Ophiocordyceps australis]
MNHYLPEIVARMVEFMYKGNYSGFITPEEDRSKGLNNGQDQADNESQSSSNSSSSSKTLDFSPPPKPPKPRMVPRDNILFHQRVNSIAHYYQLADLAEMATDRVNLLLAELQHRTLINVTPQLILEILDTTNDLDQIESLVSQTARSIVALDAWDLITTIHSAHYFRSAPFIRLLLSHCAKAFQTDMNIKSQERPPSHPKIESSKEYKLRLDAFNRRNSERVVHTADAFLHILLETESRVERLNRRNNPHSVIKDLRQGEDIKRRYSSVVSDIIALGTLGCHVVEDLRGRRVACSLCSCVKFCI